MPNPNMGLTNAELIKYLELPESTITDLQTAQGTQYQATANQFLDALFNKVLYQTVASMDFTNPFKKYDGFPVNFGDTIENIFVEIPKGYTFDKDATDPFTKVIPSVKALYASINYELQYETTIEDSLLRRACLSSYGFMNMIDTILAALAKGMNLDEYKGTLAMLSNADIFADGIEDIMYPSGSTEAKKAELVCHKLVDTASAFALPMTANNKMRVEQVSNPDKLMLIIKYNIKNSIDLDYLTGVFNLNKVDLIKNIVTVDSFQVAAPDGTLKGADIDFMVIDTDGLDMHTALQDGGLIYNPKGKYTNHFYNLWKIMSFKYFYNARAFKLKEQA